MNNCAPAGQTIHSAWLGDVEADPQCELRFPAGLPGFESVRRMIPVEIPAQRPLVYLQSIENAGICFAGLPVYIINPCFEVNMSEEERAALELPDNCDPVIGSDILCLALLMPCDGTVQANLNAPVVINLHNRLGVQCVAAAGLSACFQLSGEYGWRAVC